MSEQVRQEVDGITKTRFNKVQVRTTLSREEDAEYLTLRIVEELDRRGVTTVTVQGVAGATTESRKEMASLHVMELGRDIEGVVQRRTFGRTSLTQMRGRQMRYKPVITLRVQLTESQSGKAIFQADYIIQGPWYMDSEVVVGSLADSLIEQLAHDGYIGTRY